MFYLRKDDVAMPAGAAFSRQLRVDSSSTPADCSLDQLAGYRSADLGATAQSELAAEAIDRHRAA
jgi:hypothetical protein